MASGRRRSVRGKKAGEGEVSRPGPLPPGPLPCCRRGGRGRALLGLGMCGACPCTRLEPLGSQRPCPSLPARFGAVHAHPSSRRRLSPWKSRAFCFCFAREINSWQCQGSGRRPLGPETAGISGSVWTGCRPVRSEKEPGPPGQVRGAASRLQGSAVAVPCPSLPQLEPWPAPCARSPCPGPQAWRAKRPPNKVTLAPAPG